MATLHLDMSSFFHFFVRNMARDWRMGELRLLALSIVLAVAALSSVGFFSDRLQGGLQRDARQLLGGDVVLVSDRPLDEVWQQKAAELGLRAALTLSFPTMARADDAQGGQTQLVALKAVPDAYPLRGHLQVQALPDEPDPHAMQARSGGPAQGQVWVDAALLEALDLRPGDALWLGDARLRIERVIALEPDRGNDFMSFAPRVMMAEQDVPATGLIQPASRITWRLALAGAPEAVQEFEHWAQKMLQAPDARGMRLQTLDNAQPQMQKTLTRAADFLGLVVLLTAVLCAVAMALTASSHARRSQDHVAILRVLGLSQRRMAAAYGAELFVLALLASLLGLALGWLSHHLFVWLLAGLVNVRLPNASLTPVWAGLALGLSLMLAFGLPPILQLAQVPALRVIRRQAGQVKLASVAALGLGLLGFGLIVLAVSNNWRLGGIALAGFFAAAWVFAVCAWIVLKALRKAARSGRLPRFMVLALRHLSTRSGHAVAQSVGLAIGMMALALLILLRFDLIDSWRQVVPEDAPNRFVINIMPDQTEAFLQALEDAGVQLRDFYPMFRGRLMQINGRAVQADGYAGEEAQRLVEREFNLSYMAQLPRHNDVVAGRWSDDEPAAISVEQGLAETLGLHLGDELSFRVGGQDMQARVSSLRQVDWASMRVNFFVIFPVAQLPDVPTSWIAAFRAPPAAGFDRELVQQFPNLTLVNMDQTIAQVQSVLEQVITAVQFLFVFALVAGLVVLMAALGATRQQRQRDLAIMRALGAGNVMLARMQRFELLLLGALSGFLAAVAAALTGWALARWVFDFAWQVSPWFFLFCAGAGALLAWLAGWWSLRGILSRPALQTLREAANG